ncbi:MAG: hypothetical protein EBU90_14025 [Proteobacteria bacterium]|nr:hypothetical protein [Pseudomonadota bacterium]
MNNPKFVLAGNYEQFKEYRKNILGDSKPIERIEANRLKYINGAGTIKGITDPEGIAIGSWKDRADIEDILFQLSVAMRDESKKENIKNLIKTYRDYRRNK